MNSHLNKIGYLLFLNLSIISGILIALNLFGIIDTKFIASNNTFSAFLIIFLTGMIFCKYNLDEHYHRYNSFARSIVDSSQYFFISLLILIAANQFLKLDILSDRILILTATAIGFGFLTFYKNRDRVEKEIEEEKQKEEDEEKQRYHDFEYKFQNINRIPILRNIVRWMYKEGWVYSVSLILIVIVGFMLRIYGIDFLPIQADEWIHVKLIEDFSESNLIKLPSGLIYLRGFIFTAFSFFANLFIKEPLISVRLISVIFGSALIPLTYLFFTSYLNKKVAILSSLILSIDLYLISFSKYGRFYEQFYFFILLSIYFFFKNIKQNTIKNKAMFCVSLLLLTFSHDFGVFFAVAFFLIHLKINYNKNILNLIKSSIHFIIFGIIYLSYYFLNKILFENSTISPKESDLGKAFIGQIFNNSTYYSNFLFGYFSSFIIIFLAFLLTLAFIKTKRQFTAQKYLSFISAIVFLSASFLLGVANIRIIVSLFPILWPTIIFSSYLFFKLNKKNKILTIVLLVLAIFSMQIMSSQYVSQQFDYKSIKIYEVPQIYQKYGLNGVQTLTTHLFWTDYKKSIDFVNKNKNENDLIIATSNFNPVDHYISVDYNTNYYISLDHSYSLNETYFEIYASTPIIKSLEDYNRFNLSEKEYWVIADQFFIRHANREVYKKIVSDSNLEFKDESDYILYDHTIIEPYGSYVLHHVPN